MISYEVLRDLFLKTGNRYQILQNNRRRREGRKERSEANCFLI